MKKQAPGPEGAPVDPSADQAKKPSAEAQDPDTVTEAIHFTELGEGPTARRIVAIPAAGDAGAATDSIHLTPEVKEALQGARAAQEPAAGAAGTAGDKKDREDTEEVFVILPDDAADASGLPVVETIVVEESTVGPNTTDVLKGSTGVVAGAGTEPVSLEDVPLKKENPLAPPTEMADTALDLGSAESPKADVGEIGAIDEIADIAADLDRDASPTDASAAAEVDPISHVETGRPARRGRRRLVVAAVVALAAGGAGVLFYPQIEEQVRAWTGGGAGRAAAQHQAHALVPPKPAGTPVGQVGEAAAREAKATSRTAFRTKVLLSMQVGLRAEAGKD